MTAAWRAAAWRRWPRHLASQDVTVVCLLLLFALTLWGTVHQVDHGLHAARRRFFDSWFFLVRDFLPFPGARSVMLALFANLVSSLLFVVPHRIAHAGSLVSHWGLIVLLAGGFAIQETTVESFVELEEGAVTDVALSYDEWELSVWREAQGRRHVTAWNAADLRPGVSIGIGTGGDSLEVRRYFPNAAIASARIVALLSDAAEARPSLRPLPASADPAVDLPGMEATWKPARGAARTLVLHGGAGEPIRLGDGEDDLFLELRRRRHPLPFAIRLLDFRKEDHEGTAVARSFESDIMLVDGASERKARIRMNHPLRERRLTFYQSSFGTGRGGGETSVLAVVEGRWSWLPYLASGLVFAGLLAHFATRLASHLLRMPQEPT